MEKQLKVLPIIFCLVSVGLFVSMIATEEVEAQSNVFYSDVGLDGSLLTGNVTYNDARNPADPDVVHIFGASKINVGQRHIIDILRPPPNPQITGYNIEEGYVSFNTSSAISSKENIFSVVLNIRVSSYTSPVDFTINVYSIDYGNTLDGDCVASLSDWGINGQYQGILLNTSAISAQQWANANMNPSSINRSGLTQYKLNSSRIGIPPALGTSETVGFYMGESAFSPYLTITTVTESEEIIIYNFTIPEISDNSTSSDNNSDISSSDTDRNSINSILGITSVTLIVAVTYLSISRRKVQPPTPPREKGGS